MPPNITQTEVVTHLEIGRCSPNARSCGVEDGSLVDTPGPHQAKAPVNFCKVKDAIINKGYLESMYAVCRLDQQ